MSARSADASADIVVVGGGVAGLAAAWALRDRNVVVLEGADRIGGRVRSDRWNGLPYHLGAQYLAGDASARIFDELGIRRVALPKEGGLFLSGRRNSGVATALLRDLRIGLRGLIDVAAFGRESARVSGLVRSLVDPTKPVGRVSQDAVSLDEMSFAQAIAERHPAARSLYATLTRSLTSKPPSELSALYAYAMLGSEDKQGVGGANRALGGMHDVLERFQQAPEGRVMLDARVNSIEEVDGRVEINYTVGDETRRLAARACVVAVPAPQVPGIVAGLDAARLAALERVRYGRFLSVALFLREPVWEGSWAIACDLPVVSTLLDPAVLTGSGDSRVLSAYASDDGARQVWELPDDDIVERFVGEISQVFPRLAGAVCGAAVQRWDPGYPAWEPGHLALLPTLAAPLGNTAFCGDYLSIPSIDGAIVSGLRAAADVEAMVN